MNAKRQTLFGSVLAAGLLGFSAISQAKTIYEEGFEGIISYGL